MRQHAHIMVFLLCLFTPIETVEIQGSSNQPKGDLVFTGINITSSDEDYSSCVLFGCVYIGGENCWQLNEGNASCSDDNGTEDCNTVEPLNKGHIDFKAIHFVLCMRGCLLFRGSK